MQNKMLVLMLMLLSPLSFADKVALTQYQKDSVRPGDMVCELLDAKTNQSRCYTAIDWKARLTPEKDSTGRLKKGAMSPGQGQFTEVNVGQLISTVTPGEKVSTIDIYVKVAWKGERSGALSVPLNGQHVVRGKMKMNDTGQFQFELDSIPDLTFIGSFNPTLDVAEMFGRNAAKQNFELEHDVKSWMQDILNSVLPAVYNQVKITPKS